ncbi:hypothetical protein PRIPAC_90702 [Pristionchus pacificus]|uniref:Uncharacterized protein n=1 Tax=Pristionchus pacificus TaxID=54126 RepID=A0A2A6CWQ6_PRIPA|nr:hypothetical protein PRIPAC_90702 [Pristionchus pacificus]|eukprot:PDM82568.1 hypothetical protein PRIPAC_36961 [Pristionchus pacificus]
MGTAPWCDPKDCPEGTTQIGMESWYPGNNEDRKFPRNEEYARHFGDFGGKCWLSGKKKLCCKNSVVNFDQETVGKQCDTYPYEKIGTCPMEDQVFLWRYWGNRCCNKSVLALDRM